LETAGEIRYHRAMTQVRVRDRSTVNQDVFAAAGVKAPSAGPLLLRTALERPVAE